MDNLDNHSQTGNTELTIAESVIESPEVLTIRNEIKSLTAKRDEAKIDYELRKGDLIEFVLEFGEEQLELSDLLEKMREASTSELLILKIMYYVIIRRGIYKNGINITFGLEKETESIKRLDSIMMKRVDLFEVANEAWKLLRHFETDLAKAESSLNKLLGVKDVVNKIPEFDPELDKLRMNTSSKSNASSSSVNQKSQIIHEDQEEIEVLSLYEKVCKKFKVLRLKLIAAFERLNKQEV